MLEALESQGLKRVRMMIQGERFDGQYKGDRMLYSLENPNESERTIIQVRQYAMAGRNEDGDDGYRGYHSTTKNKIMDFPQAPGGR